MKINKNKRIGKIVIIVEGEVTEFEYIEEIFNKYLGYTLKSKTRKNDDFIELHGHDDFSTVYLINAPSNNIKSIKNDLDFENYIYSKLSKLPIQNNFNYQTYIVFDRDPINNRCNLVLNLISKYNESITDDERINGLLLLSYPAIESFLVSLHETDSYNLKYKLGKDLKGYIKSNNYCISSLNDNKVKQAYDNFLDFLITKNIINSKDDILDNKELGLKIFDIEQELYKKQNLFYVFSQLIEILIDLQIIELD